MKVSISELKLPTDGCVGVMVTKDGKLSRSAAQLDKATKGALSRALGVSDHGGKKGSIAEILAPGVNKINRIFLLGIGDAKSATARTFEDMAGRLVQRLRNSGEKKLHLVCDSLSGAKLSSTDIAAHAAYGAQLAGYRFAQYHHSKKKKNDGSLASVSVSVKGAAAARRSYKDLAAIAEGVFFTRDLVSEPPNILYPESFAARCRELTKLGVKVEVLSEARMAKTWHGCAFGCRPR